jgi:hypothetical protein
VSEADVELGMAGVRWTSNWVGTREARACPPCTRDYVLDMLGDKRSVAVALCIVYRAEVFEDVDPADTSVPNSTDQFPCRHHVEIYGTILD